MIHGGYDVSHNPETGEMWARMHGKGEVFAITPADLAELQNAWTYNDLFAIGAVIAVALVVLVINYLRTHPKALTGLLVFTGGLMVTGLYVAFITFYIAVLVWAWSISPWLFLAFLVFGGGAGAAHRRA